MYLFVTVDNEALAKKELLDNYVYDNSNVIENVGLYDTESDDSYQKYVGNGDSLSNYQYRPVDLDLIVSNFTANPSKKYMLRKDVAVIFADMAWHFWNENNGDKLYITSTYRSSSLQENMLEKGCSRAKCAKAGSSEHQLGLAIDLGVMTKNGKYTALNKGNKYYQWMKDNAYNFGFHNSYQKGINIDGQMEEGRHRRYLGTGLAKLLDDRNITFSEWHNTLN